MGIGGNARKTGSEVCPGRTISTRRRVLHKLSGSQTKQLRKFKQNLGRALRDLEAIGAIEAFEIVGDLVRVRTVPSPSQQKHLAARRPPGARRRALCLLL